ncbi:MAG: late promoter transcription accessory protein [Bacilli bacterium]
MTACTTKRKSSLNPKNIDAATAASIEIKEIYNRCESTSYLEAILEWMQGNDVDESEISQFLSEALIEELTAESINANLIKDRKPTSLTLDFLM